MIEPNVDVGLAKQLGLTPEEYEKILTILGRVPTYTELGIFSVMWSEHCSYKNSISVLKTMPRTGERLLACAGEENAGLVDIGDGLAVAFKIESHNHPSAIEPYQGAATGVGGILRDIFTMGARPIAALNSLRFGDLSNPRVKHLFKEVVKGIGDYGNSFGVPTVGGEIYFDDCYNGNPLVNAMAVGIVEIKDIARSIAQDPGSTVMIVGSATGRDGIHGATFASVEISEESELKRPAVQVGDPFTEKALLEATIEAIKGGHIIGIQDMGAAGLTCSSSEMSAKGHVGMVLNLEKVPLRDAGMNSYEIMLSESQERMLLISKKGHEEYITKIFNKWDLSSVPIGNVTAEGNLIVWHGNEKKAEIPAESLVLGGGAPVYQRESKEPEYIKEVRRFDPRSLEMPSDLNEVLIALLKAPTISNKRWVFEQYDSMVQTNSMHGPGNDAAVVRIQGKNKALALTTDCNARYVYLNPEKGGEIAVAEAARNVVCSGAKPIAITNCLNFGNPYDPEIFWQFQESVRGISNACSILGTPVTGGNVSFYNENPNGAVFPTPVIGTLGLIDNLSHIRGTHFVESGDAIILLGRSKGHIGGSEYLRLRTNKIHGDAPDIDLEYEKRLQALVLKLISDDLIKSAHDIAEGGLAIAVAECLLGTNTSLGAKIDLKTNNLRMDFLLFGEDQSRIIVSCSFADVTEIMNVVGQYDIDGEMIGRVTGNNMLRINNEIEIDTRELRRYYENTIRDLLL